MNDISNIEIEPLEDEKIEEIETRLKVDDDKRWYAPVVRWIVNRYKASREREQNGINQLKECREENKKAKADMENMDLQYFQEKQLITDDLEKWKKDVLQAADDYDKQIEQRTKDACFGAGWEWIQDDFGEQFGYDPTDDTDKGDFKQAIDEAKIE